MTTINRRRMLGGTAAAIGGLGRTASALAQEAETPTANEVDLEPAALADLRDRLAGTLLLPGDGDYEMSSRPWNGRFRYTRPVAVARCATEADVVTAIAWSKEHGVPLVGRNGGHNEAGFSTTTGLTINVGRLNDVAIDQDRKTATIGGGCSTATSSMPR